MLERLQLWGGRLAVSFFALIIYASIMGPGSGGYVNKAATAGPIPLVEKQEWTIQLREENKYRLAKLEPERGVYLGAYVLQDNTIGSSMKQFNELMGKQHASYFKYVGYGKPFPREWAEEVKAEGAFPHIAWEPNDGLDKVQDDAYIRQFADDAKQLGIPIFLRFASEMNGTWTNYSGDPELYKQKWRLVHSIFQERAPSVAMVWTVLAMPEKTIESFYPGDQYIDWVGVNVYNVMYHNGSIKQKADHEDPLDLISYVYNRFSRTKPIQLSEFGVTHYNVTDGKHTVAFAQSKLARLYDSLEHKYPRIKAVYYFDVNNVTAPNEARRINDYSLTNEPTLIESYKKAVSSSYFLSAIPAGMETVRETPVSQTFTHFGWVFRERGVLYADESFFTGMMGLIVAIDNNTKGEEIALIRNADQGMRNGVLYVPVVKRYMWTGVNTASGMPINRLLRGLPLEEVISFLNKKLYVNGTNIFIQE